MLDQKQQQQQLLTDFLSPLSTSVDDIQKKLVLCTEAQHKHDAAVAELATGMNNMTATVSALREQVYDTVSWAGPKLLLLVILMLLRSTTHRVVAIAQQFVKRSAWQ